VYKPSAYTRLQHFPDDFLFRNGNIIENTIYVCLLPYVQFFLQENIIDPFYLELYFPKQDFVEETNFLEEQRLIDMIYDIHDYSSSLSFKENGIYGFHFIIHPEISNKLPLETIFKNIHASIQIPLIQYNPGVRREKVYRLYYTSIAQNGNKIPFLPKNTITKWTEKPGKTANITMFLYLENMNPVQVSVETNGNIAIQGELTAALMPDAFNEWIKMVIFPAIQQLNVFTQQTGYFIYPFESITDEFIEIIYLHYRSAIELPKKIDLEKYMGIMSPFFYNELSGDKKRYKRIEYFKRMNPQEEFISEILRVTQDRKLIQQEMRKQFPDLTYDQVKESMRQYQEKHQNSILPGRYTNTKIEVLEHTGFPMLFQKSSFTNEWIVDVQNITSGYYIVFLHWYIQTLFEISQFPELVPPEIFQKYKGKKIQPIQIENNKLPEIPVAMVIPVFTDEEIIDDSAFELEIEYENEQYEDEEEEVEGGGRKKKEVTKKEDENSDEEDKDEKGELKNLDNYFKRRIKQRNLLLSKTGFTKICPANEKRQPIILTETEKNKIDEDYPTDKPYDHALKSGSFYYICPSYWCVQPGKEGPLTQEDVDAKKCGEVIQDPKNIQPGEFTYKWREGFNAPGFVNRKVKKGVVLDPNTGKEICYPCCFKNWYGKAQKELRQKCNPEEYATDEKNKKKQKPKVDVLQPNVRVRNVLQLNWFPLPFHRQGLLPIPIQLFLNASAYNACIDSNNMPKLNCPILLRYGVTSENQYFLGCIADIYAYQRNETNVKTNKEMREILCNAISLDRFIQLHNANLTAIFQNWNDDFLADPSEIVSIGKYRETQLCKRLDMNNDTHISFFESTVYSYENFLKYLRDESVILDPTYLWEAVTQKNPELFPRGLNLAILEIMNQDITNNVELVCPTNAYSQPLFDPLKETLIIVKQGEVYEPVYLYEITSLNPEKSIYKKTFLTDSSKDIGDLPIILKMIQLWTIQQCGPIVSTFEKNISAKEIVYLFGTKMKGYIIRTQVLNYQNKIIGFIVEEVANSIRVFVPTYPSPSIDKISTKWMDDPSLWTDHDTTLDFLQKLYKKSGEKIRCDILFRVLENEKVIGFLTMTNQFIQIMPFIDNRDFPDKIKTIQESNYILSDRSLMVPPPKENTDNQIFVGKVLSEKEIMMRNIRLETQFYAGFRNTIRILLNLYKYREIKERIRSLFYIENMSYRKKMKKIEEKLRELCELEGGVFSF